VQRTYTTVLLQKQTKKNKEKTNLHRSTAIGYKLIDGTSQTLSNTHFIFMRKNPHKIMHGILRTRNKELRTNFKKLIIGVDMEAHYFTTFLRGV